MNFSLYIARRYLISRKSHNIINIISGISVLGVMIGTMALIIVLSVFNGFEKLVISLFNSFNPDLVISVKEGKTFTLPSIPLEQIRQIPGIVSLTQVIEENALLRYKDKQTVVTIKGVGPEFCNSSGIDTMMSEGRFMLEDGEKDYAVLGYGVAYYLGANLKDYLNPISVFVPRRTASFSGGIESAFIEEPIFPAGFFSIQQDYDMKYVLLPLRFVRRLLEYDTQVTSLEVSLDKKSDAKKIQESIQHILGNNFKVKNRFQQQELLFNIMKSEKWAIFLILTFILIVATFNMVGSLSMLILDKKKDIVILQSLGAGRKMIQRIFLSEGFLITLAGAVSGLILGGIICWLQIRFGLIRMGAPDSTFVVDTYPVHMQILDFVYVFLTVNSIGFLASIYTVLNIRKIDTRLVEAS
jgi:lipoprotein-releasing system permease protein